MTYVSIYHTLKCQDHGQTGANRTVHVKRFNVYNCVIIFRVVLSASMRLLWIVEYRLMCEEGCCNLCVIVAC